MHVTQRITSFTLINSVTNQPIKTITNDNVIDLAVVGNKLNIRANTYPSKVGSVVFTVTGRLSYTRTDNDPPYSVFGDTTGDYTDWTPSTGNYTITAIPWTIPGGTGKKGNQRTVRFTVTDSTVTPPTNLPPTVNAGTDRTITLPTSSLSITGTATDTDGTVVGYAWTQTSGPSSATLSGATTATVAISNLIAGTYVFKLTATDNNGGTGSDNVAVTVNPAVNVAPTANAGVNKVLTLPTNSVVLSGSGTDSDGTIAAYLWSQVSGPSSAVFSSTTTASTTVSALIAGSYTFRLRVTDDDGAIATDDVVVTVSTNTVNQPPVARAGADKAITLPTNLISLNGSSSSDSDGTITAYRWTQVSGPSTAVFSNPNSVATNVSSFVAGTYTFRLTVTDNIGATGTDDVTLTVFGTANVAPTVNAGIDQTIKLPTNSVTLTGTASDTDGTIVSYLWTQVSGPSSPTLLTTNTASVGATNLIAGTYVYRLKVVDNSGAVANDDVTITVSPADPPITGRVFYASPNGTGTGTATSPFKISNFWPIALAGDTLVLTDGTYTGANSMIKPPAGLSGTSSKPITIKTLNDGKAHIHGQGLFAPVELSNNNNWWILEGFNASNAGSSSTSGDGWSVSVVTIQNSSNNIIRRVCAWEARDGNTNIFGSHNGNNNLFEDCAGWGTARKTFSNSQNGNFTTFRRCYGRWEKSTTEGPKKTFGLSYNSYNALAENCIGSWDSRMPENYTLINYFNQPASPLTTYTNYQVHQPNGIFSHDGFDVLPDVANIRILGCIAYLKQSHRYHNSPNRGHDGPYGYTIKGVTIKDSISIIQPGANHTNIWNVNLSNSGATAGQNTVDNFTRIGGKQDSFTIGSEWTVTDMLSDTDCSTVTQYGGNITAIGHPSGLGGTMTKRYVNGVLTTQDLWPWPMNQRIMDAMVLGGYTPVDVTKDVFELCGGSLPSETDIVQKAKSWLTSTGSARTALEADLTAWTSNLDGVMAQVRPTPTATQKGEVFYQSFTNPVFQQRYPSHQYHMYVPSHYTPSTSFGLMLWLHGGGSWDATELDHIAAFDMDNEQVTERSIPRTETDTSNYIVVAPQAPFGSIIPHAQHASRWDVPVTDQYLIDVITEVSTRYNINFNKVVIAGYSMGGIGAYHLALRLNDRIAACMAEAGAWKLGSWADLKYMPMYIIHGVTDAFWTSTACRNHNTAIEYARHAYTRLETGSGIHVLNEFPGGHTLGPDADVYWDAFINGQTGWVTDKERDPYRASTIARDPWRSYDVGSNFNVTWNEDPSPHTMWITIKAKTGGNIAYDYAQKVGDGSCTSQSAFNNWSLNLTTMNLPGARVEATITGPNQITVTTTNVTQFSLWLHPDMPNINLASPIQVNVNGAGFVNHNATPNLLKALQSYERRWDWGMIYHAEITINV